MADRVLDIPIDLIDDPARPMRTHVDEEKLSELSKSIKTHGLIQPISVKANGTRYEVIAGHRRFMASQLAGLATVRGIVCDMSEKQIDAARVHENLFREDVNAVDEGRFIRTMLEVHKVDEDELVRMTGKSHAYLKSRYDLLKYPDYLLQQVEAETISLSAAQWLIRIENDSVRREYTRFASSGGITTRRAEAWFNSWKLGNLPRDAATYVPAEGGHIGPPQPLIDDCVICRNSGDIMEMNLHYAHRACVQGVKEYMREQEVQQRVDAAVAPVVEVEPASTASTQ